MPFGSLIDNFGSIYRSLRQLPQCTATSASSFIFYLVCTSARQVSPKFLRHHMLHNFPFAHDITHYYQNVERNFRDKLQHLLDILQGLVILDLVREHGSTCSFIRHCEGCCLSEQIGILVNDQHQESKECVYSHFWMSEMLLAIQRYEQILYVHE